MTDLIRPVLPVFPIEQPFIGAYKAEKPGWYKIGHPTIGRRVPFTGGVPHRAAHFAIDYGCPSGRAVHAMHAGLVVRVGPDPDSGNAQRVQIRIARSTRFDLYTMSYHLTAHSFRVKVGDQVNQNDVTALSDCTGWCDGPHLHEQMVRMPRGMDPDRWYFGGTFIDAQPYIDGVLRLADIL